MNATVLEMGLVRCNQVKKKSYWSKVGPKSHHWCPHKRHTHTHAEGGWHVWTEAEMGVMHL